MQTPTTAKYASFQHAYTFFNRELFNGQLPEVLITLQRHPKAYGYFHAEIFANRENPAERAHELAMNPDTFGRTDKEILGTLVHEMTHVWQQAHGEPSRNGYHNKQWAAKMREIGLQPVSTDGGETGQRVSHEIVAGGPFELAFQQLEKSGFTLAYRSLTRVRSAGAAAKRASKTKFQCPECEANAWAKPDASLLCGECRVDMEPV